MGNMIWTKFILVVLEEGVMQEQLMEVREGTVEES